MQVSVNEICRSNDSLSGGESIDKCQNGPFKEKQIKKFGYLRYGYGGYADCTIWCLMRNGIRKMVFKPRMSKQERLNYIENLLSD